MDTAAMNRSLDNDYGTTHGPNSPSAFKLGLFMGDPLNGGTEVTTTTEVEVLDADGNVTGTTLVANGYARADVAHADFAASADGVKATTGDVTFPAALAEYPDMVTHWQLYSADDGSAWDSGPLAGDGLEVASAGGGPAVALSIFYADAVEEPA